MSLNIMMDGAMFPDGWNPVTTYMTRDHSKEARPYTRTQRPPRYYLIDFGISRRYSPEDKSPLEPPILGGDKSVPEFMKSVEPCNPFPTDIYYFGNVIRQDFLKVNFIRALGTYTLIIVWQSKLGCDFMATLVQDMVQDDPSKRPTIDEAVVRFKGIRQQLSTNQLRARLVDRGEGFFASLHRGILHFGQRLVDTFNRIPAIPSRKI